MGHAVTQAHSADQDVRDRKLIAGLRNDDTTALSMLIDLYAAKLRDVAFLVVRRTDLAEDVVQSTFVSVWERRAELTITGSVAGYLYRTARNLALKLMRHERAEQRALEVVEREYVLRPATATNDGAIRLDAQALEVVVHSTLDGLQPQVREIFLMRRLHGMSYEEIAAVLELSILTVRSQMSRAMRRLADALND